jgi:hypothetical protein
MKTLFVAGDFDEHTGRFSKLADRIYSASGLNADYHNGGNYSDLLDLVKSVGQYNAVVWLASIPEDNPRISARLKDKNSFFYISSRRNLGGKISTDEIVRDALKIKSNLVVEFKKSQEKYFARVLAPTKHLFLDWSSDFDLLGKTLGERVLQFGGLK